MDEAGDHEDLKYLIEDQGKCQSVLECKNLSYSVKSTRIFRYTYMSGNSERSYELL